MRKLSLSLISWKGTIPILILLVVGVGLTTLLLLTGRDPVIAEISPTVVRPGDQLVLEGRYLGSDTGAIWIAGVKAPTSSIITWTNERIEFTVPRGSDSGLLFVVTAGGSSDGTLLQLVSSVPRSDDVAYNPGTPQISSLGDTEAVVGSILVLDGKNFGSQRRDSAVLFSSTTDCGTAEPHPASVSYPVWTDGQIHVRIPSGAESGFVSVDTAWGRSNPMRLRILRPAGRLVRTDRTEIAVRYGVALSGVILADGSPTAPGAADVIAWLPELRSGLVQANVRYLEPPVEDHASAIHDDVRAHRFEQVDSSFEAAAVRTVVVDRYGLGLEIDTSRVSPVYEGDSGFFAYYTRSTPQIPSQDDEISVIAAAVRRNRASPYQIARAAYDWVLGHMEPGLRVEDRGAKAGFSRGFGDDYTYSVLLVSVLRAALIPSRLVGGLLLGEDETYPHFWVEFFVPAVGWVPADPFLGDGGFPRGLKEPASPSEFYFGNIDSLRLAFHHGSAENGPVQRDGRPIAPPDPFSAQRNYLEVGSAIQSIHVDWSAPRLLSSRPWAAADETALLVDSQ